MDDQKLLEAKLTATNYPTKKFKFKHLFIAKELFESCDRIAQEPVSNESAAVKKTYKLNEKKALSDIVLAVSDEYT